eukprot:TRINITY_DN7040_c0_g1_i1.p2 TRINITY_DN7040_c0_g1~~TRINITY_DN7040_c0_g1_i1.p2  ORF type:complete len:284 (-),score=64.24 TRINITY_DN7040_c0_g1_i1:1639-2490(-)
MADSVKLPTPELGHITSQDFDKVYEPAQDTFLLLDALQDEAEVLREARPFVCLEIGPGSGCVITFLGQLLLRVMGTTCLMLGADINAHAASIARATGKHNKVDVHTVVSDLGDALEKRLRGKVDVLLFNPPYVPSEEDDEEDDVYGEQEAAPVAGAPQSSSALREDDCSCDALTGRPPVASAAAAGGTCGGGKAPARPFGEGIEAALIGGERGRKVIDRFLPLIPRLLSPTGLCYLLLERQNDPKQVRSTIKSLGLKCKVVKRRNAFNERLQILRCSRPPPPR